MSFQERAAAALPRVRCVAAASPDEGQGSAKKGVPLGLVSGLVGTV